MSHKVDIVEVTDFSTDLEESSSNNRSSLDKVQEKIETIDSMESFTGKAADQAKGYFNELHLTLLESFRGLFDDLNENLNQHIKDFGTEVDASESAIMESNYLQDIKEDINELYESLQEQDDSIQDTIGDVSDITSASSPSFSDVEEWKKHSIDKLVEVDDDLDEFTSKDNEVDVEAIMLQIEDVMSKTTTSKGKARFADFKGASEYSNLVKLMEYNEEKQNKEMEKAKDARDSALEDRSESSSQEVINKVYQEYKNGNIEYAEYIAILEGVKNTSGDMDESKLREDSTDNFINYLKDHNMLDNYLDDHRVLAEHLEIKEKEAKLEEQDPDFKTIAKEAWQDFKDGLLDYESYKSLVSGTYHSGGEFLKNMINSKYTEEISEEVAERLTDWWKRNTTTFMDRGLTLSFAHGGDLVVRETPSNLAKVLRTGAKYSPQAIGSLMDFGSQVLTGEDVGDAAIKTTGHAAAGAAGFAIGSFIPVPVLGSAVGFAAGVGLSMAFDWAYDNGLKEGIDKVGDAVTGFFSDIGSIFT